MHSLILGELLVGQLSGWGWFWLVCGVFAGTMFLGGLAFAVRCYHKVSQGTAIVRNGLGGTKVDFSGQVIVPIIHKAELMDISVKRIEIDRSGEDGLICKDNMRADIKVAFFVRVNKTKEDVKNVAQLLGCERASQQSALVQLFEAKFSEALENGW